MAAKFSTPPRTEFSHLRTSEFFRLEPPGAPKRPKERKMLSGVAARDPEGTPKSTGRITLRKRNLAKNFMTGNLFVHDKIKSSKDLNEEILQSDMKYGSTSVDFNNQSDDERSCCVSTSRKDGLYSSDIPEKEAKSGLNYTMLGFLEEEVPSPNSFVKMKDMPGNETVESYNSGGYKVKLDKSLVNTEFDNNKFNCSQEQRTCQLQPETNHMDTSGLLEWNKNTHCESVPSFVPAHDVQLHFEIEVQKNKSKLKQADKRKVTSFKTVPCRIETKAGTCSIDHTSMKTSQYSNTKTRADALLKSDCRGGVLNDFDLTAESGDIHPEDSRNVGPFKAKQKLYKINGKQTCDNGVKATGFGTPGKTVASIGIIKVIAEDFSRRQVQRGKCTRAAVMVLRNANQKRRKDEAKESMPPAKRIRHTKLDLQDKAEEKQQPSETKTQDMPAGKRGVKAKGSKQGKAKKQQKVRVVTSDSGIESGLKFVGAHCSIAGGVSNAVGEAAAMGAKAFGLFVRNGRTWKLNSLDPIEAEKFKAACKEHGYPPHLILPHGSYLLNCGSVNPDVLQKSRETLVHELQICESLGLELYNFHPGSACGDSSVEKCIQTIAESINLAHKQTKTIKTVIENMSCQGQTIGGRLEELRAIIDKVEDKSRVGVCLDTCHAFAAGFDLSTEQGYQKLMEDFESIIGLEYLSAFHLNDSKGDVGCHLDRHENIGKGKIGLAGFTRIMNDPRLVNIPMILETPVNDYAAEIRTLYKLVDKKA
ncbi:DNA-(apurinic or apyrimidinic site) lyase-like [Plakobranchus ocellatus]|uniref:DNA-(Apurinic or apyrimidinic site) lyase-like n=1 Tax=Plakobranchus ocellatus TaxID=259542 RepID=A0AAV4CNC2_9GAST|nr:DNA-(apurinic or apyrimidinic site) lyase-like [Plakobranchus ocellatus]